MAEVSEGPHEGEGTAHEDETVVAGEPSGGARVALATGDKPKARGVAAATVQPVEPKFDVRMISEVMMDEHIAVQLVMMDASVLIWVGQPADSGSLPAMGPLCLAMETRFERMPLATTLLDHGDQFGPGMAQRLAKRTGRACYVSCCIPEEIAECLPAVERRVLRELIDIDAGAPPPPCM